MDRGTLLLDYRTLLLIQVMAGGAAHLGVGRFVAVQARFHRHRHGLFYAFLFPHIAMTFPARDVRGTVPGMAEENKLGEHVHGSGGNDGSVFGQRRELLNGRFAFPDLPMAHHTGSGWRITRALTRFGSGVAVGAIELERGVALVTERNRARL